MDVAASGELACLQNGLPEREKHIVEMYLIPCTIERSGSSSERVFKIQLSQKVKYRDQAEDFLIGTANAKHLTDENRQPITEDWPSFGNESPGYVRCAKIRELSAGWLLVEVPSSDVIHVSEAELVRVA